MKMLITVVATVFLMVISAGIRAQEKFFTLEPIDTKGISTTNLHKADALDYFAPKGTPIYPVAPGKVFEVVTGGVPIGTGTEHTGKDRLDYDPGRGLGNYVIVEHEAPDADGKKFYSTYAHMENVAVAKGVDVKIDTQIGAVGDTGLYVSEKGIRAPHLHVQVDNVEPEKNEHTGKLFPVFSYAGTDSRHGNRSTKELTENPKEFIERYADKTSTYGTSRQKYNEYVEAQKKEQPTKIATTETQEKKERNGDTSPVGTSKMDAEEMKRKLEDARKQLEEMQKQADKIKQAREESARAQGGDQYKENDNLSSTGRPKVIDTTTNYFAVATVFSPSSGSAHLLTATGFEMRRDVSNTSASYDTGSGYSGSIGTASVVDQGSNASAGNLNWGRWSGAGSTNIAGGVTYTGQNFHYVFGSAPTNIPSSGSVTYNPVGGTNPTSSGGTNVAAGTQGTFNSGTIGVNFATRAVTVSNLNFSVSTATFNMNGSSTYNSNALFSGSMTGTCTGAACSGAVTGNHIGTLTGPAAAGIALGYQAHTTGTGMVVGAQGFIKQ